MVWGLGLRLRMRKATLVLEPRTLVVRKGEDFELDRVGPFANYVNDDWL